MLSKLLFSLSRRKLKRNFLNECKRGRERVSASLDRLAGQFKELVEQMKGEEKSKQKILRISEDMAESIKQWADLQGLSENNFLNYAIGFYILFSQESSKFAVGMTS
jgi:hypothetical protein